MNMTSLSPEMALRSDRAGDYGHRSDSRDALPFASLMAEQVSVRSGESQDDAALRRKAETRQAAEQLVSSAFILPVLKQLRETSWAEGPFAAGAAEKRFGPMLDQHLADRIVQASGFDIVDAITERYAAVGSHSTTTFPEPRERFERIG